jgi:SAM-dependent methyltransferase
MISSWAKKIYRSWKRRGVVGTLGHAVQTTPQRVWALTPAGRCSSWPRASDTDQEFDLAYGVDTGGAVDLADLFIPSSNWAYGAPYEPIEPVRFHRVIEAAALDYPRFTFIDLGSGKGRALLLAREYPFRKIVGVEFAPALAEISRRNLRSSHGLARRCGEVEVVCLDVTQFPIPEDQAAFFVYNPFEPQVMSPFVDKVRQALQSRPRELVVLYLSPFYETLWLKVPQLKKVHAGGDYSIYRTSP